MGVGSGIGTQAPLAIFTLDAGNGSPDERWEAWRAATAALFDSRPVAGVDVPFTATIRSYSIGPMLFGRSASIAQAFVRDPSVVARSGVDHLLIQLYVAGGYRGTTPAGAICVEEGDISVLDLASTFETQATGAFDNLNLIVPRALIAQAGIDVEALHALVFKRDHPLTQLLGNHLAILDRLAGAMSVADGEAAADVVLSLLTACLRHAPELAMRAPVDTPLARARHYVEEHLADPALDARTIASACGMSRATLYRLFEPVGGVAAHVRSLRMRRALFELSRQGGIETRIAAIALRCGYENATSFSRAFHSHFGVPPTAVKLSAQRKWPSADMHHDEAEHPLTDWIRHLLVRHARRGETDAQMPEGIED